MNWSERSLIFGALLALGSVALFSVNPARAAGFCANSCSTNTKCDKQQQGYGYSHCCKPNASGGKTWHNCIDYSWTYWDFLNPYDHSQGCDYNAQTQCDVVDCGPATDTGVACT